MFGLVDEMLKPHPNRPNCLFWVKTKGKKVKRTKKQKVNKWLK